MPVPNDPSQCHPAAPSLPPAGWREVAEEAGEELCCRGCWSRDGGPIPSSEQQWGRVPAWTGLHHAGPPRHRDRAGDEQYLGDSALPDHGEAHLVQPANTG